MAPTILDLLGIRATHAFAGLSLFDPAYCSRMINIGTIASESGLNTVAVGSSMGDFRVILGEINSRPPSVRGWGLPSECDLLVDHFRDKRLPLSAQECLAGVRLLQESRKIVDDLVMDGRLFPHYRKRATASIFFEHKYIAHALGAIDGHIYTNSLDAFVCHYKLGRRVFEVDVVLNRESQALCFHSGKVRLHGTDKPIGELGVEEYGACRVEGKYGTITCDGLGKLLREKRDWFLVVDSKDELAPTLASICQACEKHGVDPALRVVPQIYHEGDYEEAMSVCAFKEIIYTLYRCRDAHAEVLRFAAEKPNITVITCPYMLLTDDLIHGAKTLGVLVFTHTVNRASMIESLRGQGVHGFYTDSYYVDTSLTPASPQIPPAY